MTRKLAAIMFTDISGYTSLTQQDEAGALQLLREQEKLVRPLLGTHHGHQVKSIGDGLLIEFPDALDAVEFGVDLERRIHERNARVGPPALLIRVGIHLGDVQRRGSDILGDAVNIASRVQSIAEPEGLCLSAQVFEQVRNKVDCRFEKLGPTPVKGVEGPIELYRAVYPWSAAGYAPAVPLLPRLAILPIQNISPDAHDEYLAEGLTEELTTVLSQLGGLRVVARTSAGQYRGTTKSIAQIGAELGVSAVLEGSVRKDGDRLRITVQLIDTKTQEHRWVQTYERKLENVFAVQAEIAERTAEALKVKLLKSELHTLQRRPTHSLEAYEEYLRGIEAFRRIVIGGLDETRSDQEAERHFEAAIHADPEFSEAHSYLANHLIATAGETRPLAESIDRARRLVARALELNPNLADAHTARGNLAMQGELDWPLAEAEFRHAIGLDPGSPTARFWYGMLLTALQRFDEASEQYLEASTLDPLWTVPKAHLASNYGYAGDWASSIVVAQSLVETFPTKPRERILLARAYCWAGQHDAALRCIEGLPTKGDILARVGRAWVLQCSGRTKEAKAAARSVLDDSLRGRLGEILAAPLQAGLSLLLGDRPGALDLLEADMRSGDRVLWFYYLEPVFDAVRTDPRFVALLEAMHLPTGVGRPLMVPTH
jgi:adenylate cyclase